MARTPPLPTLVKRLPSGRIPRAAIRKYVRQVVEKFHPERVILFGSHAYGKPNADSDVDLLVVMPAKNDLSQSIRIRQAVCEPFPMDLFSISPDRFVKHLRQGNTMLKVIVATGVVLYDAGRAGVGA